MSVDKEETNPVVTDLENVAALKKKKKPNPGWKKIEQVNLKRYVARQRREMGLDGSPISP